MEWKSTRQRLIDENETRFYGLSCFDQSFPKPKSADSIPIYRVMVAGINCPAVVLVSQQALI
jgi:hypothetical protein